MILNFIKRLRLSYAIYNFFHKKLLVHNMPGLYKYGIRKNYFSSVSSKDFKHLPKQPPVEPKEEYLRKSVAFNSADANSQQSILDYTKNGYLVIHQFLSNDQVDRINHQVDDIIKYKNIHPSYGRYMQLAKLSPAIASVSKDPKLIELCKILLDGDIAFFQSINFLKGSEQQTHSDSFHMTTYPEGGLLGIWIALEDVDADQGPLHYYPGSHNLPYFMNDSFGNEGNRLMLGKLNYPPYASMIQEKIKENGFQKQVFHAEKGDLLIWHANLLHGGEKHNNHELSRKSLVLHYMKKGCICYHEISQRPALIEPQ
jgi:phytanoyl-CoA hydroxylase